MINFSLETGKFSFIHEGKTYKSPNGTYIGRQYELITGKKPVMAGQTAAQEVSAEGEVVQEEIAEVVIPSDSEVYEKIQKRFEVLDRMVMAAAMGENRATIVYGPAGTGKTTRITRTLDHLDAKYVFVKGYISAPEMYNLLYKNRSENSIIVFDDCDEVLGSEASLNILKAACDSTDSREISWMVSRVAPKIGEDGEEIPATFTFEGSVIIVTNKDLKAEVAKENKLSPHCAAMISRANYINIGIENLDSYVSYLCETIRRTDIMGKCSDERKGEVIAFIQENKTRFHDVSLRLIKKLTNLISISPETWREDAEVTQM
jgi:hypothetical protein